VKRLKTEILNEISQFLLMVLLPEGLNDDGLLFHNSFKTEGAIKQQSANIQQTLINLVVIVHVFKLKCSGAKKLQSAENE